MKSLLKLSALVLIVCIGSRGSARAGTSLAIDGWDGHAMSITLGVLIPSTSDPLSPQAEFSGTLTTGSGSSSLNLYCVDLFTQVAFSTTYSPVDIRNDGVVASLADPANPFYNPSNPGLVPNASQVAWLVHHLGPLAAGDPDLRLGLQAAIWRAEYGPDFALVAPNALDPNDYTTSATQQAYQDDLTALNNANPADVNNVANVATVQWLGPYDQNLAAVQAFVADLPARPVPEPGSMLILLGLGAPLMISRFRRRIV